MQTSRRLWWGLAALLFVSFGVLLWMGREIYRQAPPVPQQVQTESGRVLFTREDFDTGRVVWQSIGGMQLGSVWGHGALVAPDWSADWMHREGEALADHFARQEHDAAFVELTQAQQEAVRTQRPARAARQHV